MAQTQGQAGNDQDGMHAACREFEAKSTFFSGQLRSVNDEMLVLQGSWQGTASLNFNQAMDSWEGGMKNVIDALNGMIGSLGGNASLFAGQEQDAAGIARDFGAALPGGVSDHGAATPVGGLPGF